MTQSAIKPPRKPVIETKAPAVPAPAPKPARVPTHDEISVRARALWESKGRPAGQDKEIWLEAEAQLKKG